jgi:hypothetical protein
MTRNISLVGMLVLASMYAAQAENDHRNTDDAWIVQDYDTFFKLSGAAQNYFSRKYQLPEAAGGGTAGAQPAGAKSSASLPSLNNALVNNPKNSLTQNETCAAVASDGTVVVAFNDATSFNNFCGYAWSSDGVNFHYAGKGSIPDFKGTTTGSLNSGDGVVAASPGNVVYYAMLADDTAGKHTIGVSKSTDGGKTFAIPSNAASSVANTSDFQDKPWMTVDPASANVYVSWTDFFTPSGDAILFSRSTDGGMTWSAPIALSPLDGSQVVQGSTISVGPSGEVYVAWQDGHSSNHIALSKSTDGGVSFGSTTTAASFSPVSSPLSGFDVNSFPSMAVDQTSGKIYITFNYRPNSSDRSDIGLISSTNGGTSFSSISRVNGDGTQTDQFMPSVAVNTAGQVAIQWYDRRASSRENKNDVYARVNDVERRLTDVSWSLGRVQTGLRQNYHGDYNQLVSDGVDFLTVWGDERSGNPDVAMRTVAP